MPTHSCFSCDDRSAMKFSQMHSIHEADVTEWDSILGPRDVTHSYAFSAALEESQRDCVYRYIAMRNEMGELVAHANICVIPTALDLFLERHTKTSRLLRRVRSWWPKFLISNVVECGNPVALGQPFVFRRDLSQFSRKEMVLATYQAMMKISREEKADLLVVRDFCPEDDTGVSWTSLIGLGFVAAPNLENAVLDLRWKSFTEYLNSLRSHYRYRIRAERKKAQLAGIRCERVTDFASYAPRLAELWQSTADRATAQLREQLNAEFFASISRYLGRKVFVSLFWRGDVIVAFSLYFDNGDELVPLYVGIDYAHNDEASLVFNSYYDWIETGIELGYRRLELGITTYEPKLRIGGQLERLSVLMRHRYSWLTQPSAMIYRWFTPQQNLEPRHVFRDLQIQDRPIEQQFA